MRSRRLVPLVIAVALVAMLPSPASAAWSSTKIEDWGSDPDADFFDGATAVVYTRRLPNPDAIRYAELVGGVWQRDTVVSGNVFFGDADPQLTLDGDGRPWVFFEQVSPAGSLLYFRNDGGDWVEAWFLDGENAQDLQALSTGEIALLHRTGGIGPLNYSLYDVLSDTLDTEEVTAQDGISSSMVLNDEDVAKIAYDETDGQVHYATQTMSGWDTELVSGSSSSSERPSITLSFTEQPRIAYVNNSGLMFAYQRAEDLWGRRLVHGNSSATHPVIRTAQNGLPQIAYLHGVGPFHVRWAVHTGNGWAHTPAFSKVGGPGLGGLSLIGVGDGTPRIGYNGTSTVRWGRRV